MSRFFATVYESDNSSDEELLLSSDEELISSSGSDSENDESSKQSDDDSDDDDSDDWNDSDDDDSDDSDDDYSSGKAKGPSYFLKSSAATGSDSDSDSDSDEKIVVKSAKEKYLDEVASSVDQIENFSMVQDWVKIATEHDKLSKLIVKYPQYHIPVPRLYIKSLAVLEDTIIEYQENEKETKKKLNASESKSLNITRQRVKKSVKEFQSEVDKYRKDPEGYENGTDLIAEAEATRNTASQGQTADAEIFTALRSIVETRGKRNVDHSEQIETLESLIDVALTPFQSISIYLLLIPVRFDLFAKASFMPLPQWKLALRDVSSLLNVLEKNKDYIVSETATPADDFDVEPEANEEGKKEIIGSVASLVERLADELTSHLLAIDPHSREYVSRLRDESLVYSLIVRAQLYYEGITKDKEFTTQKGDQLARTVLKRLDSIYFKPSHLIIRGESRVWTSLSDDANSRIYSKYSDKEANNVEYTNGLMDSLCSILYKQSNSIYRKKAVLYHIYYYAFNDQYYKARDMLLLSHLQSTIHTADPQLQVLFNRAIVQLGLSAFRSGLIVDAQHALQELATSARQRELLGQGVQRFQAQQSQVDKQRLLPFHMHINLELIECSFYTASMLIEIPQIAENPEFAKKRQSSPKAFRRVLEYHERQTFNGPPENARDHIMLASRSLSQFDWKKASDLINSIKIWELFANSEQLKKLLQEKLQIEALRTYIFKNKAFYTKCSISNLSSIFELSENNVRSILAKMIHNEDINALINLQANTLEFVEDNSAKPTKLQQLVLSLGDKCSQIIERNERLSLGGYQIQLDAKKLQGKKQQVSK